MYNICMYVCMLSMRWGLCVCDNIISVQTAREDLQVCLEIGVSARFRHLTLYCLLYNHTLRRLMQYRVLQNRPPASQLKQPWAFPEQTCFDCGSSQEVGAVKVIYSMICAEQECRTFDGSCRVVGTLLEIASRCCHPLLYKVRRLPLMDETMCAVYTFSFRCDRVYCLQTP